MKAIKATIMLVVRVLVTLPFICFITSVKAGDVIANAFPKLDSSMSQTISLNGGLIYDSNPLFISENEGVWVSQFKPRYAIQHNSDQDEQYLELSANLQQSSDTAVIVNRQDSKITLGTNHLFNRGSFSVSANYAKRSIRLSQINETGLVTDDGSVVGRNFSSSLNYLFSPRLNGNVGFSLASNRFDQAGQNLLNFNIFSLDSGLSYEYNSLITANTLLGFTRTRRAGVTADLINAMVGANWTITPKLDLKLFTGINHVKFGDLPTFTGLALELEANYINELDQFNTSFKRSVRPTGLGLQESNKLVLDWNHSYNEYITYGGSYQLLQTRNLIAVETQVASVFLNKKFNSEWSLRTYLKNKEVMRLRREASGLTVGLTLGYGYSDLQDEY